MAALFGAALLCVEACGSGAPAPVPGAGAPPAATAAPAALASVRTASGLVVDVVRVHRPSRDVVQVDLLAVNVGPTPADLEQVLAPGLEEAALVGASGDTKSFVLRDDEGAAQASPVAKVQLSPGTRRALFVRFGALSSAAYRGTLQLPGLPAIAGLQVPAGG